MALLTGTAVTWSRGLPLWVLALLSIASVATFLALAMITKIITGEEQLIYLNGQPLGQKIVCSSKPAELDLPPRILRPGRNVIALLVYPMKGGRDGGDWDETDPGLVRLCTPPAPWQRSVFNGLAQVIVQSTGEPGEIILTAQSSGLKAAELKLLAQPASRRPAVMPKP